ncbi:hypothetical protein MA16_Dca002154 [Dendrobium catenatum]|uniref:Uncharacterized protein n=1 Tax=Dendrobium catenatum TaxID=906689 RepID=A0A2I0XEJ4_9ASPA|nr:hypothetical protein MA16_Dca002154 [Dendrobium catenatum]
MHIRQRRRIRSSRRYNLPNSKVPNPIFGVRGVLENLLNRGDTGRLLEFSIKQGT